MYRILLRTPPGFRNEIKDWSAKLLLPDQVEFADHELGFIASLNDLQLIKLLTQGPWFEDIMFAVLWRANVPHREYIAKELKRAKSAFKDLKVSSIGLAVRIKHDPVHTVRRVREAFSEVFSNTSVHGQDLPSEAEVLAIIEKRKMTLWVSLSGSGLYKRGQRDVSGFLAPMREDVAASILSLTMPQRQFTLWLPFAGSGTFFYECNAIAKGFYHPNTKNLLAMHLGQFKFPVIAEKTLDSLLSHSYLEDIHPESISKLRSDIDLLGLGDVAQVLKSDFFSTSNTRFSDNDVFLPVNPPWGDRLGKSVDLDFYKRIGQKISTMKFKSLSGFVLCPDASSSLALSAGLGYKPKIHHFTSGGKHIRAVLLK